MVGKVRAAVSPRPVPVVFGRRSAPLGPGAFAFGVLRWTRVWRWICGFSARKLGVQDPSAVVWDEIVAFWIVLLLITPASFVGQLVAFVLFRFFDAVKPPPIRYFDRTVKGGLGIMLDDLVAAFCTLLVIALWRSI